MNTRERFVTIMNFEKPDRMLRWELGYWYATLERWYREGLESKYQPSKTSVEFNPGLGVRGEAAPHEDYSKRRPRERDAHDYLGFDDGLVALPVNAGPQPPFERKVFEDTDNHIVFQDEYGVKKKLKKLGASTPEFVGWPAETREGFERLKEERFSAELRDRIPESWPELVESYKNRDYPTALGGYPFGFYGFLRYMMGEERLLYNFYDDPDLVRDMMSFFADFWIELWNQVLDEVEVDCVHFWEDMSYKSGPLISPAMFREFMSPCYRRITDSLKDRGVSVIVVDTDGNIDVLLPLFLEAGLTGIYPIEVQAGNDLVAIRERYPKAHLMGGIDKIKVSKGRESIDEELEGKLPFMLERGGYIPHLDHHVHPEISWQDFCYYRRRLEEFGG
jgi:uroporphyrinogen decarboxylase